MGKTFKMPAGMMGGAQFSGERPAKFRTVLFRYWAPERSVGAWGKLSPKEKVMFIGHNPSDAGARMNDPTIAKCCRFALAWGYKGIIMHNLMDRIGDDPSELLQLAASGEKIMQPENMTNILRTADEVDKVICCWGRVHPAFALREVALMAALEASGVRLWCIDTNSDGSPKHPLYIDEGAKPFLWEK